MLLKKNYTSAPLLHKKKKGLVGYKYSHNHISKWFTNSILNKKNIFNLIAFIVLKLRTNIFVLHGSP